MGRVRLNMVMDYNTEVTGSKPVEGILYLFSPFETPIIHNFWPSYSDNVYKKIYLPFLTFFFLLHFDASCRRVPSSYLL